MAWQEFFFACNGLTSFFPEMLMVLSDNLINESI
jgi:hypothetical protein